MTITFQPSCIISVSCKYWLGAANASLSSPAATHSPYTGTSCILGKHGEIGCLLQTTRCHHNELKETWEALVKLSQHPLSQAGRHSSPIYINNEHFGKVSRKDTFVYISGEGESFHPHPFFSILVYRPTARQIKANSVFKMMPKYAKSIKSLVNKSF